MTATSNPKTKLLLLATIALLALPGTAYAGAGRITPSMCMQQLEGGLSLQNAVNELEEMATAEEKEYLGLNEYATALRDFNSKLIACAGM